jgi:hypothetical protein
MARKESLAEFIERVLSSGLLIKELVFVPEGGATDAELTAIPLPGELRALIARKNGLNLDVVRIHGVGQIDRRIRPMVVRNEGEIEFASDAAGFAYLVAKDGSVSSVDHDGGERKCVANNVDTFLRSFVFGSRAAEFGGPEWALEVADLLGND